MVSFYAAAAESFQAQLDLIVKDGREGPSDSRTRGQPFLDLPGISLTHPLHTMADSFAVHEKVAAGKISKAAVVGAGYIGVVLR